MFNIIRSICLTVALLLITSPPAVNAKPAKASKDFTGTVVKVLDGDTYLTQRDGDKGPPVKVRLHLGDCPERAHNANEVDQPFGKEATDAASKLLLNKKIAVHQCGLSYGRIVGDVHCGTVDVATELTTNGFAQVDPRYHPSKELIAAEADAKKNKRGLWSDPSPIAPWDWRQMTRDQQIKARSK